MNRQINKVLEDVRHQLEAEGADDTTYGPGVSADVGGKTNKEAEAGAGGAINPANVSDALDAYVMGIADTISLEYNKGQDEALKFVFNAATALSKDGLIPPMPGDDAPPEEVAVWLGKASSTQFAYHVMQRARDMLAK